VRILEIPRGATGEHIPKESEIHVGPGVPSGVVSEAGQTWMKLDELAGKCLKIHQHTVV
jgi:hypothetical protein